MTLSPRILIVRLSAIGDVMHALPVLNALRARFPQAYIAWLVEGRAGDLLQGHAALNELIRVPRKWLKSPRIVWNLRRQLRTHKFDIAIDVQGLTKSAVAARLSGARRRIGFAGPDGRELSSWLNNEKIRPSSAHVVDRNLELLRPLGIEHPEAVFYLPELAADEVRADDILHGLGMQRPLAIINPGAGWPSKVWPAERFAAMARHLWQAHSLPSLVVWAGNQERAWAEEIVRRAEEPQGVFLAPPTSLTELAALCRRANLFVGSDTGPLHIAAAVGTPCVGLFGPMPHERNGPYGQQHIAVQKVWLTGSSRERRTADNASMRAIAIADVCAACDAILARLKLARVSA
jgi:lipopolysaccharide heptosyltransferase I